jgi:hypothetical protein
MAYSLSSIPGYDELNAQTSAVKAQIDTLLDQRDAVAAEYGIASPQAQQFQQQASALTPQYLGLSNQLQQLILSGGNTNQNSPTVTTAQSQSTPPDAAGTAGQYPATGSTATAASAAGASAPTDDNFGLSNTTAGTTALLNAGTNPGSLITPQPNILDQYASYTYNLGWYLLKPTQFAEITNVSKLDISQWSLLVQSGGAAAQQAGVSQQGNLTNQQSSAVSGRNKYFTLDYYMDDLEITSTLGGGGPSTLTEISFKVTEPNGITLLPNLTNAVRDMYQETTAANNLAFYVMVVKFYGWDINGHLITDPTKNTGTPGATPGITNAVITRYYPFQITEFNFKMANRAVEYQIKGTPQHFQYGQSSGTASIPYNIELTGETVSDVLTGTGVFVVPDVDDSRESTNKPSATIETGPSIKSQVSSTALSATGADTNVTTEQGVAFNLLSG